MRRFWLLYPEPNKALERTAYSARFWVLSSVAPCGPPLKPSVILEVLFELLRVTDHHAVDFIPLIKRTERTSEIP
jgi:hypothetical protein